MASLVAGLMTASCSVFGVRTTPEPSYTVERQIGAVEIRRYGERIGADTVVQGDEMQARNLGFRRLAGYIFGANSPKTNIEMTAPVVQTRTEAGGWRIRFFMPTEYSLQNLPAPNDRAVDLVTVPPERVAVLRYSGLTTAAAVQEEQTRLLRTLEDAGIASEGLPFSWFYDPPWTIPPLRRNEAVVRLGPP